MTSCYAKGCKNHTRNGVKMSSFPKNPIWREIWTNNCKKFGATTYTLPHDHSALCEVRISFTIKLCIHVLHFYLTKFF